MHGLTRQEFLDITTIEVLSHPSRERQYFNCLLKMYDLPRYSGWGDIPRSMLPAEPDQATLQWVAGKFTDGRQQSARELEASRVQGMLAAGVIIPTGIIDTQIGLCREGLVYLRCNSNTRRTMLLIRDVVYIDCTKRLRRLLRYSEHVD